MTPEEVAAAMPEEVAAAMTPEEVAAAMTPEEVAARLAELLDRQRAGAAQTPPEQDAMSGRVETRSDAGTQRDVETRSDAGMQRDVETRSDAGMRSDVETSVSGGGAWAHATVDVPPLRWRDAVRYARDDAALDCDFFDWLSAVDDLEAGFVIVTHLWSTRRRHGMLIRTRLPREAPAVPSIVDIYPGASWHERETHEMFGVGFDGHPGLAPLLLPPEFEGYPLRKEFILATRVAKPWPGAKEPGDSHDPGSARRQPMRPPGVPDPTEWGPRARRPDGEG